MMCVTAVSSGACLAGPLLACQDTRYRSLLVVMLSGLLAVGSVPGAQAATIEVAAGAVEVNVGDGMCSLREAILNATTDSDVSAGDCPAGAGADEIVLAPGAVYVVHDAPYEPVDRYGGSIGATGLPPLAGPLVVHGREAVIERAEGAPAFRLLFVAEAGGPDEAVHLEHLTLRQGQAEEGGGIYNDGVLVLTNSTVRDNLGGGIFSQGTLRIADSMISDNEAGAYGGGLHNDGALTIENSTIQNNRVAGVPYNDGGGIFSATADMTLVNTTITGNAGGGLNVSYGGGRLIDCVLRNNTEGDLYYWEEEGVADLDITGSAIDHFQNYGLAHVSNSTLGRVETLYNSYTGGGHVWIASSTVTGQISDDPRYPQLGGRVTLRSSIARWCSVYGGVISEGFNLFGIGCGPGPDDRTVDYEAFFTEVLEPDLADNGGPTPTYALRPGSPALDAGRCTGFDGLPITTDQRGEPRPSGAGCDIGAFELQVGPPPDATAPVCGTVRVIDSGGSAVAIEVSPTDTESGIQQVAFRTLANATAVLDGTIGPFTQGQQHTFTAPYPSGFTMRADKIDPAARSSVVIEVTNGAGLTSTCDPVLQTLAAEVPEAFALEQNYPNPFNPSTEIVFALPEAVAVRLVVYDVTGREVVRLVDEVLPAGTHRVTWSAAGLPSGVYFYRLTAGAFTEARQMMLLK